MKKVILMATAIVAASSAHALFAFDNGEDAVYGSGFSAGMNGGTGFLPWVFYGGGGGAYMRTDGRRIEGARSFAMFSGSGGFAIGREFNSIAQPSGRASFLMRHDLGNTVGPSGAAIKSAIGTSFGASALLSFGLTPTTGSNGIAVSDGNFINLGTELRGSILEYDITWGSGTYTLRVTRVGGGGDTAPTGSFETGTVSGAFTGSVKALAWRNENTGAFQDAYVDRINAVPEPMTMTALGLGLAAIAARRRKKA